MQKKLITKRRLIIAACILVAAVIIGAVAYRAYDNYMMKTVYTDLREGKTPDGLSDEQIQKYIARLEEHNPKA
jgi:uncharacterized membrane protein YebE (DUF533 family)